MAVSYHACCPAWCASQARLGVANEQRVNPDDLLGRHKYRKDKEERMKSVLEGEWGYAFVHGFARWFGV